MCCFTIPKRTAMTFHLFICTWPPSDDLVNIFFNIFLNIPTTARSITFFFSNIILVIHIHYLKCNILKLLNIFLYSNEQTSIKLKLFNIWKVIEERSNLFFFLIIKDLWYCWNYVLSFYGYTRNMQYFLY